MGAEESSPCEDNPERKATSSNLAEPVLRSFLDKALTALKGRSSRRSTRTARSSSASSSRRRRKQRV